MPIAQVKEVWSGRVGSINEQGTRRYRRVFMVRLTNITADALEATATSLIPGLFTTYQAPNGAKDLGATCRSITPEQLEEDPFWWKVVCEYSNERTQQRMADNPHDFNQQGQQQTGDAKETNPLLRAPQVVWDQGSYVMAMEKDAAGNAVVSTNSEPFDPPLEEEIIYSILRVSRNEAMSPAGIVDTFVNKTNDAAVTLCGKACGAETALCRRLGGESQVEQGAFFWKVNYEIWINALGWDYTKLAVGTYTLDGNKKKIRIKDPKTEAFITSPVPLTAAGLELDLNQNPIPYAYVTFKRYATADFTDLQLPA